MDISEYRGKEDADLVICQALLEHVKDTRNAFRGIASTLKPGGLALIFVLTVTFSMGAGSRDKNTENVQALYYKGSSRVVKEQINNGSANENNQLNPHSVSLPSSVDNLSSFALQFEINGSASNDYAYIDDVSITSASSQPTVTPTQAVQFTVNVKDTGAKGDGVTDDRAAIQAAVDQVGGTGGTVFVPDGTYMVNAVTSIRLKSAMTFQMSSEATLKALPNGAANYDIIRIESVSDVNVTGGTLLGERDAHLGTTGEWGMGIDLLGADRVLVDGVTIKNCWGDGIYIGDDTKNVTISSVTSDTNRRQGMSITWGDGITVKDSVFKNTNGTAPEAGIDIEPNLVPGDHVNNVQIIRTQFLNNKGWGVLLWAEDNNTYPITNVTIDRSTITDNNGGIRLQLTGGHTITKNTITDSQRFGIELGGPTGNTVAYNTITVTGGAAGKAITHDYGGNTIYGNTIP